MHFILVIDVGSLVGCHQNIKEEPSTDRYFEDNVSCDIVS